MKAFYHYFLIVVLLIFMSGVESITISADATPAQQMTTAQKNAAKKAAEKKKKAAAKQKAAAKKKKEAEKRKAAAEKQKAAAAKAAEKQQAAAADAAEKAAEEQTAKEEKQLADYKKYQESLAKEKTPVVSYFNLGFRAGYAAMMDKVPAQTDGSLWGTGTLNQKNALQQLKGGPGAGIGLNYNLEYKHLLFEVGLDFRYLNSTSAYGFSYSRLDNTYGATYHYLFDNLKETRNLMQVGIPVMLGAQFSRYYFLLGAKVGYSLWGNYNMKGQYDITVNDPKLLEPYGLGIEDVPAPTDRKLTFKQPEVSLCAEVGLDLDEWLQAQPAKKRKRVKAGQREPFSKEYVHYRVGLFAEYGLLNTNEMSTAAPMAFASDAIEPAASSTMLGIEGTKMNNLFIGAKFTIQFEVPGKAGSVHKSVPTPPSYLNVRVLDKTTGKAIPQTFATVRNVSRNRVIVKGSTVNNGMYYNKFSKGDYRLTFTGAPINGIKGMEAYAADSVDFSAVEPGSHDTLTVYLEPRPYLTVTVRDAETGKPLAANVQVLNATQATASNFTADSTSGAGQTMLADGDGYKVAISMKGYEPSTIDVRSIGDNIEANLTPIKVGRTFVLKNMFFATGKTKILEESEPALETLYEYLTDEQNTARRIRIIGHTDNVGKDAANQKLSEGRANAVRDALIEKGIESSRLEAEGRGESEPIDTNDTEEGRQNNRRVEIMVLE